METRQRSIVKALIWQGLGLGVMTFVGWIATGSYAVGGALAVVNCVVGLVMYIFYERIWAGIRWGRRL